MNSIFDIINSIESNECNETQLMTNNEDNEYDETQLMTTNNEDDECNETQLMTSTNNNGSKRSFNMMVEYIKQHHDDIPEGFRGTCLIDEENNLTLAMYWVYIMKTVSVPKWMRHNPDLVDSHGWTIAHHYVATTNEYPPEWMICNPTIKNVNGRTVAMLTLIYRKEEYENTDIPNWMKHSVNIVDKLGHSLVDYWIYNNKGDIPEWMTEQMNNK